MRVSPDGRDVAIRNLHKIVSVVDDGPQWSTVSSQWLTDEQVDDWLPLAVQRDHVTVARAPDNSCWVVEHNGEHAVAAVDPGLAAAVALTCVQRAGGTALVTVGGGRQEFAGRYHKKHRLIPLHPGNEG